MQIEGDLYFKLIDFGSLYGADEEAIAKYERIIDSLRAIKAPGTQELWLIRHHDFLKRNKLMQLPSIHVKTDSGICRVYLSEEEYDRLKTFDRITLFHEGKKVSLSIQVKKLEEENYLGKKILSLEVVEGQTYVEK